MLRNVIKKFKLKNRVSTFKNKETPIYWSHEVWQMQNYPTDNPGEDLWTTWQSAEWRLPISNRTRRLKEKFEVNVSPEFFHFLSYKKIILYLILHHAVRSISLCVPFVNVIDLCATWNYFPLPHIWQIFCNII